MGKINEHNVDAVIDSLLSSHASSRGLRRALEDMVSRDPVDAYKDYLLILQVARARMDKSHEEQRQCKAA